MTCFIVKIQELIEERQAVYFRLSFGGIRNYYCHPQVRALNAEADKLKSTHPNSAETVESKFNELHSAWATLSEKAAMRKKNLNESYALQKYLNDYRYVVILIEKCPLACLTVLDTLLRRNFTFVASSPGIIPL